MPRSSSTRVAFARSVSGVAASSSTTSCLATRSISNPSPSTPGPSPAGSGSNSSRTARTAGPSCGCRTAGPHARPKRWDSPLYWYDNDGSWWYYTLAGPRQVRRAEPVCHVSYYEADAFARWAGARLPTESRVGGRRGRRDRVVCDGRGLSRSRRPAPESRDRHLVDVRRRLAVDVIFVLPVSRIPPCERCGGRVQRKVHGQPVRASGRQLCDPGRSRQAHVPQLLPAVGPMGLLGAPTGPRCLSRRVPAAHPRSTST